MHFVLSFKVDGVSKLIAVLKDTTIVCFILFVVLEEDTLHLPTLYCKDVDELSIKFNAGDVMHFYWSNKASSTVKHPLLSALWIIFVVGNQTMV